MSKPSSDGQQKVELVIGTLMKIDGDEEDSMQLIAAGYEMWTCM